MRIGELASKAGLNPQTIRFYERRRILPRPSRTPAGYRCYAQADFERLQVIRRCQQLGFSLGEIQQLLPLHQAVTGLPEKPAGRPRELRQIAEMTRRRLDHIEGKLCVLRSMRMQLLNMLDQLETVSTLGCPASTRRQT
jgi:MerR family transcriptional regulator, mercuric resistance operon regulatory protein